MIQKYIEHDFNKSYITVTYKEALFKVCFPVENTIEFNTLKNLITHMDKNNLLEIELIDGFNIKQAFLNKEHKRPYIYECRKDFLERIEIIFN